MTDKRVEKTPELPKVRGVGRDPEDPSGRTLFVALDRKPTDDEVRALHGTMTDDKYERLRQDYESLGNTYLLLKKDYDTLQRKHQQLQDMLYEASTELAAFALALEPERAEELRAFTELSESFDEVLLQVKDRLDHWKEKTSR